MSNIQTSYHMPKIEADVVIVLVNPVEDRMEVYPLWECEIPRQGVRYMAASLALTFGEKCGSGYVEIEIIDHRPL